MEAYYFVDRKTGKKRGVFKAEFGFYSTPTIYVDSVFASSLAKHLYCIDLDTLSRKMAMERRCADLRNPDHCR